VPFQHTYEVVVSFVVRRWSEPVHFALLPSIAFFNRHLAADEADVHSATHDMVSNCVSCWGVSYLTIWYLVCLCVGVEEAWGSERGVEVFILN
jgi:hypothetical protein